ncbi:transglycosylase domain-containing protein [Caldalkalibacillus mannanilyticus]|uniref:transglycosylase domain-containing protein n=1 Tax=Caldalkalibacillus mannanilyticus TaxID=1418 RepID=UPI0006847CF3|nr:penicillin-binding transpeptidase domain-containing protein [Caldalkalibacillus mannanilyticus]
MIILNHDTGAIVAISGGREYVRKGYNRATQAKRQPGSSFKPIAVYATALEQGWSPYDDIQDQLINYNGYQPRNYDGVYRGKVQMKEAVEWSYNAPAVWLLHEIGIDHGIELAQKFGFHDLDRELGIALGSVKASPLQMASAFGAFANDGVLVKPYVIEKIVTPSGESIVEVQKDETQVVSAQTAWAMTTLLQGVIQNGTGKQAQLTHDVAGKTGTTQSSERGKNVRDAWFVGYTPQYSAAVWIGFDQMDAEHRMESSGGNHPAKIFRYVMDKMLEGEEVLHFSKPEGVHNLLPKSKKKNEKAEQKEKKGKKDQKDSKKKKDREDKKNKKNKKEKQDRKREN